MKYVLKRDLGGRWTEGTAFGWNGHAPGGDSMLAKSLVWNIKAEIRNQKRSVFSSASSASRDKK
jgi:hypothetical protein